MKELEGVGLMIFRQSIVLIYSNMTGSKAVKELIWLTVLNLKSLYFSKYMHAMF